MANIIPYQLNSNYELCESVDSIYSKKKLQDLLKSILGNNIEFFDFKKRQRIVTAKVNISNRLCYLIITNITCMGGQEGQHPKDLKRIQYTELWREYYKMYGESNKVYWLGLYSFDNICVFASFSPETYINRFEQRHGKTRKIKSLSTHVYLNDIFQGATKGIFHKKDKNGNQIYTISKSKLKDFLSSGIEGKTDAIQKTVQQFNESFAWNKEVMAKDAIMFMKSLEHVKRTDKDSFNNWKQNKWNGWYLEALYSKYFKENPSENIVYVETSLDERIRRKIGDLKLDLSLEDSANKMSFIGDLKASSISSSKSMILNDVIHLQNALNKFGKVWFFIYLHTTKPGKTNDYEMVKWRNHFILNQKCWKKNKKFDELSAKGTPYSITFTEMVIVEFNHITSQKYFSAKPQPGKNSNNKIRKWKFNIKKKYISEHKNALKYYKMAQDDGLIIYRYKPETLDK